MHYRTSWSITRSFPCPSGSHQPSSYRLAPPERPTMSNLPRTIESDLQSTNLGLNSAWLRAQNRYKWRSVVETAMLTAGRATWWWWWSADGYIFWLYVVFLLSSLCKLQIIWAIVDVVVFLVTAPICHPAASSRSMLPAKHLWQMGYLCYQSVSLDFVARQQHCWHRGYSGLVQNIKLSWDISGLVRKCPDTLVLFIWYWNIFVQNCLVTTDFGYFHCETSEPVICELTCELGRWLDVTSHACHVRFAKYRTGFTVRIVSSAGLINLIAALLKAVAFVCLWLLFLGNCLCRLIFDCLNSVFMLYFCK